MTSGGQSVAVIGAGAVGGYYGARLAEAGHDVRFLLRRDFDAVAAKGLRIQSPHGDLHLERPTIARTSVEIGPADWVVCALKSTSLEAVPDLLGPCLGEGTRILVLMNGLGLEERFAEWFPQHPIFGGMAFVGINRAEPGTIDHQLYGAISIGHLGDEEDELERARSRWAGAKVEIVTHESLLGARWEKLCWNIPFNGLGVAAGGVTTEKIVGDPGLRATARGVMEEVVAAGNAELAARGEATRIDGPAIIERMFQMTDTMPPYRSSTVIDFVEGRPLEVEAIFGEPARRAAALGGEAPLLQALAAVIGALARS